MGQESGSAHNRRAGITPIAVANIAWDASTRRKNPATESADPRRCRVQEVRRNSTGDVRVGHYLAQDDTPVMLARKPYRLHDAVTVAHVECKEMSCGLRGIESQFLITMELRPAFGKFQQCRAQALPLKFRMHPELVGAGHGSSVVPHALGSRIRVVKRYGSDHASIAVRDVTLASRDAFPCQFHGLVHAGAIQIHLSQAEECAMQHRREFIQRIILT